MSFYSIDAETVLTNNNGKLMKCDLCLKEVPQVTQNLLAAVPGHRLCRFAYVCDLCNENLKELKKRNHYGKLYVPVDEYEDWKAIVNCGEDPKEPECK